MSIEEFRGMGATQFSLTFNCQRQKEMHGHSSHLYPPFVSHSCITGHVCAHSHSKGEHNYFLSVRPKMKTSRHKTGLVCKV